MINSELMMENTALRVELKKAKKENERLRQIIAIGDLLKKTDITKSLVEVVVKDYYEGKKLQDSIEKVKSDLLTESRLQAMISEFLNPSQKQIEAEIIFKEREII